jgi:hypothetical protein
MHGLEFAAATRLVPKSSDDLSVDFVPSGRQKLFNEFTRSSGHGGLGPIPVPGTFDVEVRGPIC